MNELQSKEIQTISSREVAEMMERRHGQVLKMIEGGSGEVGIIKVLAKHDFVLSDRDYFVINPRVVYRGNDYEKMCWVADTYFFRNNKK